ASSLAASQSGLVRADGSPRPSYEAVKDTIATTGGKCLGREATWRHTTSVDGAAASFSASAPGGARFGFRVTADEGASFRAGIFRANGKRGLSARERPWIETALAASGSSAGLVARVTGGVKAYWPNDVRFGAQTLAPGLYLYAVRLAAETNP